MPRQVFRSGFWRGVAVVWAAFVAFNAWDIASRGFPDNGVLGLLVLGAATVIVYAVGWRPAVVADGSGVSIRNPARTIHLPWNAVTDIDATDALRVHDRSGFYRAWAVSRGGAVANTFRGAGRSRSAPAAPGLSGAAGTARAQADALAAMAKQSPADYAAEMLSTIWRQARGRTKGSVRVRWAWPEAAVFVALLVAVLLVSQTS